jgi:hypothetical protein
MARISDHRAVGGGFDVHPALPDVRQAVSRAVRCADPGCVGDVDAEAVGGGQPRALAKRDDDGLRLHRDGDGIAEGDACLMGDV